MFDLTNMYDKCIFSKPSLFTLLTALCTRITSTAENLLETLLRSPTYLYIQPCLLSIKSQAYIPFHQFPTGLLAKVTERLVKMRDFIVLVGSLTIFAIVFPTMATDKDGFNFYKGEFEFYNSILRIFFSILISHLLFIQLYLQISFLPSFLFAFVFESFLFILVYSLYDLFFLLNRSSFVSSDAICWELKILSFSSLFQAFCR